MATIKYWNGSAWELAIVGKQGPAGPTGPTGPAGSASLQRFRFVATGSQTSVSGTDANGNTLAYTPGLEEVFINGAAQVRGQDYTATNGTSITGIGALLANDVVEILAWGVFDVANTISNTLIDAKGDILAGSAADTVSRLAVGANNTVLTADSSTATGLKWAAPAANLDWTSLSAATPSGSTYTVSGLSGYNYLLIGFESISTNSSAGPEIALRFNADSTVKYSFFGGYSTSDIGNAGLSRFVVCNALGANIASGLNGYVMLWGANSTGDKYGTASLYGNFSPSDAFSGFMRYTGTSVISSISLITSTGSFDAGTLRILGAN